jgi:DNA replication and repair protein RecF
MSDHIRHAPLAVAADALWAVAATVSRKGESYEIGTGLTIGPNGGERRQVRLNGAPATGSGDLGELVQMIWLTPAMDRLFIEGTSGRRKFLDRLTLGFDPAHGRHAARYETAMRERARLLKFGPRDPTWLEGLESEMAESGIAVAKARRETVDQLNMMLSQRADAGAFPAAGLSLSGETDALVLENGDTALDRLRDQFAQNRMRDAESGRTLTGPHLSDLSVRHTQKRADARECSTGEQKALLISIVLAHAWALSKARDGVAPILLLDEIAAHLDATRRTALFEEILSLKAQAWMTGTEMDFFTSLKDEADLFEVADSTPRLVR